MSPRRRFVSNAGGQRIGRGNLATCCVVLLLACLTVLLATLFGSQLLQGWKTDLRTEQAIHWEQDLQKAAWLGDSTTPTLIIYAYAEGGHTGLHTRWENLRYFLKKGLIPVEAYTFLFVVNGCHSIQFPQLSNVHVLERENSCFDAGAWMAGLTYMEKSGKVFARYILMNNSVRGPFLPQYFAYADWVHAFTAPLADPTGKIKLVGTTLNCWLKRPADLHLQSMILATDRTGLEVLKPIIYSCGGGSNWTHMQAVVNGEVMLTQSILNAGYSLYSQMLAYDPINGGVVSLEDWKTRVRPWCMSQVQPGNTNDDTYYAGRYGGIDLNPLELMFFKTNRGVAEAQVQRYTDWLCPGDKTEFLLPPPDRHTAGLGCNLK